MSIETLGVVVTTHQEFRGARVATAVDSVTIDGRPAVLIDPEDRAQVDRLAEALEANGWQVVGRPGLFDSGEDLADALREFANPTPPKPKEPTGLGAVVEAIYGNHFVRDNISDYPWRRVTDGLDGEHCRWVDIAAVRVLSEGVTP